MVIMKRQFLNSDTHKSYKYQQNEQSPPILDRIICLLCVYIFVIIYFLFIIWTFFLFFFFYPLSIVEKGIIWYQYVQIIKRKYIMTNIDTQDRLFGLLSS